MPTGKTEKEKLAHVAGRIISDPVFRKSFVSSPDDTLKDLGLTLDSKHVDKLKQLGLKVGENIQGADPPLHCNIASNVGVA